jgi:nitronate monooxygenase
MTSSWADLGLSSPLIAAPMAGGPTTAALVIAAARAEALGFLAGGYKTPAAFAGEVAAVRAEVEVFGVNLFAPNPVPVDPDAFRRYAHALQVDADRYGLSVETSEPIEDDDYWSDKVDVLLADPVPVVSFTFGIPAQAVIRALQRGGTFVLQTVTSPDEAKQAVDAGVDGLAVQGSAAGGHSGTFTPAQVPPPIPLVDLVRHVGRVTNLPLVAAGGLATSADITDVLSAGAIAAAVGTVLLRADESGASAPVRAALADPARSSTLVTRAFTGRPARALRNEFTDRYDAIAPLGYPALHHLTSPVRRAAAAANDAERINLWAGTGYRQATAEPVARILARLAAGV